MRILLRTVPTLKLIHVFCAYATGLGFLLRGVIALVRNPVQYHPLTRTLPHIIDTCLFLSGLTMFLGWGVPLNSQPWLIAKLIALLVYIGCGFLMLRFGTSDWRRLTGLLAGLAVYVYIIGVAHGKSVMSFFAAT